ncbi:DUF2752 domain-containing protein [Streptomonospora litoralis]|uniref:DUF2752 domain-containing protein n=1 Tax=Streptomonospora litoralis TaxID=2498135 RepID=A0A4P6Q0I9_9ACTN|nr:DUF2752 domain-containing protein [Streptomonospora litoralis]QBI53943.1 hypothetical protein EKD16_10785 [Streptomonospora litoralis]
MSRDALAATARRRLHPAAAPLLLAAAGAAGAVLLHFVDPNEGGNYPVCPWLMITGTWCPGCGTMRAIHAMTELDVAGAFGMNPMLMLMAPFLAYGYVRWLYRSFRPAPPRTTPKKALHPAWLYLFLVAFIAYWVVRNLPFGQFLAPG